MMFRLVWLGFGIVCVGLAFAGGALPLLRTTPFLLLAVFAFARSSRRMHDWLVTHRQFGPLIRNWREHGSIDRRTKTVSVAAMIAALVLSWSLDVRPPVIMVQALVLAASATFILTRPDGPRQP